MKKYEDMTLEDSIKDVYVIIKNKANRWTQIILWVMIISIATMNIFKVDTNSASLNLFSLILIGLLMLQTNSNSKAIAKIYEKIMKEDNND